MSQSTAKETVLMRIEIGMDSRTKKAFEEFKAKSSQALDKLSAIAAQGRKADGGLLRAMAVEAANDGNDDNELVGNAQPEPELQALGQWVFEGQDENLQSATVDETGIGCLHACKVENLEHDCGEWYSDYSYLLLSGKFEATNWQKSAINRQPINDVDYLSDSIPHIDDVLNQPNWLSESIIPITETDLQSIFIKNLSTVLIQRMHSMDRFSEDDYHVGGDKLMAWDIVIYEPLNSYAVLIDRHRQSKTADLLFFWDAGPAVDASWNTESAAFEVLRTIAQDELDAFRTALEACYVQSK